MRDLLKKIVNHNLFLMTVSRGLGEVKYHRKAKFVRSNSRSKQCGYVCLSSGQDVSVKCKTKLPVTQPEQAFKHDQKTKNPKQ